MPNHLYDALLASRADDHRPLLRLPDGSTRSAAEMLERAAQFAAVFAGLGAAPGDRIAVQVEKSPDALAVYFACLRGAFVLLPLNTAYTSEEVAYFVGDAEPAVLLVDPDREPALAPIAERFGAACLTLDTRGAGTLPTAAAQTVVVPPADRSADSLAAVLYTSGTTGRSKGAMLSGANLIANAQALVDAWRFDETDVLLHALPIYHTHGLFVAVNVTLLAGGSLLFLPAFETDEVLTALPGATAMMGVPTYYTRLLARPELTPAAVAHLRLFVSGSAPLLSETHAAFAERTGQVVLERYGMTETGMLTSNPYEGPRRPGTVGLPLPGVAVRVTDPDTGVPVEPGGIGVVEVRGPNVFSGYWRRPEITASEFRPDGFFITGDLGRFDAEGYLELVGRGKDLIISGGLNVYPREVEAEIDSIAGVDESAVIGVPHPDLGEAVVAVIVLDDVDGPPVDDAAVRGALTERLARFKQPRRSVVVDALPRNTMGKVQKNVLRERFADLFRDPEST